MTNEETETLPEFDWSSADSQDVVAASACLAQPFGDEVILTFGYFPPPTKFARLPPETTDEEFEELLSNTSIKATNVTKVSLPISYAIVLAKTILDNVPLDDGDEGEEEE